MNESSAPPLSLPVGPHAAWRQRLHQLPAAAAARSAAKRVVDLLGASLLLTLAAPVILLAVLAVRWSSPGAPALFSQPRIGYRGRPFRIFKIRTMVPGAERREHDLTSRGPVFFKTPSDPRITPVGRWLRRYSLDELPQLLNVLRGDMSLVGPRPILVSDFGRMPIHRQLERFAVKPGLTGLWQVSGRSLLSDERRMELDLEYVRNWSLVRDLRILARTLPAVVRAEGAN